MIREFNVTNFGGTRDQGDFSTRRFGLLNNIEDDTDYIVRGDGHEPARRFERCQIAACADQRRRVEQPFRKEVDPQMHGRNRGRTCAVWSGAACARSGAAGSGGLFCRASRDRANPVQSCTERAWTG